MTSKITHLLFILLTSVYCFAQTPSFEATEGAFVFNPEKKPCLTEQQRNDMRLTVETGIASLKHQNRLSFSEERRGNHPLFSWPIQKANTVDFNDVWAISGYVDHDSEFNNNLLDYNCGSRTYDTSNYNHQGLDVYTWPFTWKLMDDNGVEIIAAAPGQIVAKSDGAFDRSCDFNTTTPWNAVYIQHSDGSVAIYGHMKNGSVTTKNIGDMVTEGEYLGIVGSSGVSTGPHLHFEVYEGVVDNVLTGLIDPFSGSCNSMNADSWWADQKPYVNPKINAALTHSQVPNVFPPCPTTETPHISNTFETDDTIYFAAYLRDQTAGDNIQLEIIRPDNSSLFGNWNITVGTTASSWYYYWYYSGYFDMVGEWKWQVTFAGETVTHTFNVSSALNVDQSDFNQTSVYPNPFNDVVTISSVKKVTSATVVDVLGKSILSLNNTSEGINSIDLSHLLNGMYFLIIESETKETKTIKLIKE
ncbi:peptidoglycan DD-metalloendopeptidase family protein [Psychroserpens sp. SPM9]|uniref:peptidoglycan DD-metalloendopeptidase family protein n=1 Tax=Psychroserpens sp. SPM9 TaxID=2975598 RepID=UPI0021A946F4|nr:peptidoglycan DD-metalloendopeptidase family protein [Psychroserpens sp. SPM9]MDG5491162.1 peptidoglycan DD-metalloendopeptidase family protein [Psychroserpens sp. SPM9]